MVRRLILLLLVSIAITVPRSVRSEIWTESGLVDIPTGSVLKHGIFGVGTYLAFQQQTANDATTNLNDAVAFRLNFGLFDRVEIGLKHLWKEYDSEPSTAQTVNLKVQLLKEQVVGVTPNVAIGIEGLTESDQSAAAFLAISKTFNLPRIHQFSGHIGIGTQHFAFEERPVGLFVGLHKEFQPAFARGDITMSLAFDGEGMNAGMRYITASGLQVALGAETLNNPDELRYLAAVSWTNQQLLEQIAETRGLIQRATELVIETKRAITEKKEEK